MYQVIDIYQNTLHFSLKNFKTLPLDLTESKTITLSHRKRLAFTVNISLGFPSAVARNSEWPLTTPSAKKYFSNCLAYEP